MTLTNAEKQKRWREKRNVLADALTGTPKEIADSILFHLGPDTAKKVVRALDERLRNLKSDCPACRGTGFITAPTCSPCGMIDYGPTTWPCDCSNPTRAVDEQQDRVTP